MVHLPRPLPPRSTRHRARLAILVTTTAVLVVGCSSTKDGSPGRGPTHPATNPGQAGTHAAQAAPSGAVDACALLNASDVATVIGSPNSGAVPSTGMNPDTSECSWTQEITSPYSFKAIHLNVSAANTAAGDQLPPPGLGTPPPVPGIGAGARMILVGTIEFPAGGRACQVQVVGLADDAAKRAAITLAGLVRSRA